MSKYATFVYGDGTLYGSAVSWDVISPDTGPSTGNIAFTITGLGFESLAYDDTFEGATLDTLKWLDISSGTGSVATGSSHLEMDTGATTGAVAGVESLTSYLDIQQEFKVYIPKATVVPASTVNACTVSLYVDSNNYAEISVDHGTTVDSLTLTCNVYVGGTLVDYLIPIDWTTGSSVFKILRWGTDVYFYANGSLLFKSTRFVTTTAKIRAFTTNNAANYTVLSTVEYIKHRTFVTFGNQVVHAPVIVSDSRLRGITPPSLNDKDREAAYAGLEDVSVIGANTLTRSNYYTYYFEDVLVLLDNQQGGVKVSVINDSTVRTPRLSNRGLGEGR